MTCCGCHQILIALCYPQDVFCPNRKSLNSTEIFHLDDEKNAQRWQRNTNWRHKKRNPDHWKVRYGYPWMLVNWICLCFLLLLCSQTLTLIVADSSLKIEEWLHKMAISLKTGRVKQNNHPSIAKWPDRALRSHHLRRFLVILSVHLCIPVSLPPFHCVLWSAFGLLRIPSFSHSASLYLLHSKTHLQKAFSLDAGALSLSHSPPQ